MGYAYYIIQGKECGYSVEDVCNEEGCQEPINRGLAYACGGSPGEMDDHCGGYFCYEHLFFVAGEYRPTGEPGSLCLRCLDYLMEEHASNQ